MLLKDLNEQQLEAVKTIEGPLLILAGAGSGKTRVLTTRIAYMIEKGINPYNILAITFTNKAATEMKERVRSLIGAESYKIHISTFHSFGLRLIRENLDRLGYQSNFTILDSDDSLTLIKRIMKNQNIDPKMFNPRTIKNRISGAKNQLIKPFDYKKYANTVLEEKVEKIYIEYEEILKTTNSFDFDDLLIKPIELLEGNEDLLKKYNEQFQYILIDEYQDTNEAQYKLTKLISNSNNICVVGDADQSIYSFRGANHKNILNFEKDFKKTKTILLEENYRSTSNILNAANDVISNNKKRKEKKLWTSKGIGHKIRYKTLMNEKEEASYLVEKIQDSAIKGVKLSEIAVLYRTNAQSRAIEEELLKKAVPYKIVGGFTFYNRKEIKDLIAYLKLINNPYDDTNLIRIINTPKRGIGAKTIEKLVEKSQEENTSLFHAITSGKEAEFKKIIDLLIEKKEKLSLTELVEEILDKAELRQSLKNEKTLEADIRLENLEEFKTITKEYEDKIGIIDLDEFLNEISLVSDVQEYTDLEVVTLMTVHAAKGLEFEKVFMVGLEEGIFPHINSLNEPDELEEERRLCYVAITRAKKRLWILNTKSRMLYGNINRNPESRFIKEISEEYLDRDLNVKAVFENINKNIKTDETYNIGEKINHKIYGQGIIVNIEKTILTIAFSNKYGIRQIIKGHRSITKEN